MAGPHRQIHRESVIKPAAWQQLCHLGLQSHLNSRIRPGLKVAGLNQPDEGGKGILTTFPFFDPCSYPIQATGLCFQDSETELDQGIRGIGSEFLVPTKDRKSVV